MRSAATGVAAAAVLVPVVALASVTASPTCGGKAATMVGSHDDDILIGTNGDDVIVGRGGDDLLDGGRGRDFLCGGRGNDRVSAGEGFDYLRGGRGGDLLELARADGGAVVRLERKGRRHGVARAPGLGRDKLFGVEDSYGTPYRDRLKGGRSGNRLIGLGGDDDLRGRAGGDVLRGGGGSDAAWGGAGNDICRSVRRRRGCEG